MEEGFKREIWRLSLELKNNVSSIINPITEKKGITVLQAHILFLIKQKADNSIGSLAKKAEMGQGNLSAMCKKLEKLGFIKRKKSYKDERVTWLVLTDTGEKIVEELRNDFEKFIDKIISEMPEGQGAIMLNNMRMISDIIKDISEKQTENTGDEDIDA